MARPQKYPEEVIQRGIRLVCESGRPIAHVAHELGLPAETLQSASAAPRSTLASARG